MEAKGYRDLRVWQAAMTLVERIYAVTRCFPKEETYGLTSQIRRAAISVPSNIAEGHGRNRKEFRRYAEIAYGSLSEVETQIELARRLAFIDEAGAEELFELTVSIARMLNGLKKRLSEDI